jgi:hypothetical protein
MVVSWGHFRGQPRGGSFTRTTRFFFSFVCLYGHKKWTNPFKRGLKGAFLCAEKRSKKLKKKVDFPLLFCDIGITHGNNRTKT